jgi:hypothetical protein
MTVEMIEPFIWPEDNSGEEAFGKESLKEQEKDNVEFRKRNSPTSDTEKPASSHAEKMKEQAQVLLSGKKTWTSPRGSEKLRPFTYGR